MLSQFRTYQLAVQFHRMCRELRLPHYLRDQLLRAAASVALNLAEGQAKPTVKDQLRFYSIAMASLRECQAALELAGVKSPELIAQASALGGSLYRLQGAINRSGK